VDLGESSSVARGPHRIFGRWSGCSPLTSFSERRPGASRSPEGADADPPRSPRLPEGAGRSLHQSSAAFDVLASSHGRYPSGFLTVRAPLLTPNRSRYFSAVATASMHPRLFVRTHMTRRAACRARVRNPTALHSKTSSVVPRPSNFSRSAGCPSPPGRSAEGIPGMSHPVHPYGSDDFHVQARIHRIALG